MIGLLKEKLNLLPHEPGCYLFYNRLDEIIYVGKAKDIYKRVHQYFLANQTIKTKALVASINNIDYIITNSENEALILENNLIKKHNPFYNIKLTDGKTYPYIVVSNEINPRVYVERKVNYQKVLYYYGPFTNQRLCKDLVEIINNLYPFRKCYKIPDKKCLYYDLNLCLAPCINKGSLNYSDYIKEIKDLFDGRNILKIKEKLTSKLYYYKDSLNYEEALKIKYILEKFIYISNKQIINQTSDKNADYIGYAYNDDLVSIFILKMRDGIIKDHFKYISPYKIEAMDLISSILNDYYLHYPFNNLIYFKDDFISLAKDYIIPKIGDNLKLSLMAYDNAKKALAEKTSINKLKLIKSNELKSSFDEIFSFDIDIIDAIDIAQLFGTNILGGVIRIVDNTISINQARFYHLDNQNLGDVNLIYNLALKHYSKVEVLPSIIFVDGGMLQVKYLSNALAQLGLNIPVAGLAKDQFHNLDYLFYKERKYDLERNTPLYQYLRYIDESIHNYIIKKHQGLRIKTSFKSRLEQIKGVGSIRANKLLLKYSSYDEIKKASVEELKKLGIDNKTIKNIKEGL